MHTDQELLQRYIQSHDGQAFAELAQRYAPMVYAACLRTAGNRADAEDAAQETLLQLARTPDAVRSNLGGWLYCTARSKATDQMRSAAVRRKYEEAVALERFGARADEYAAGVDEFVGTLGEELREPLVLHFFRGLSQEQVAAELQLSQPTVSRRIERAIELLRSRLQTAGITAAPAAVLASASFRGDAVAAGEVAQRVAAVVNSVHSASTAAVAGSAVKASIAVKAVAAGLLLAGVGAGIVAAVGIGKGNPPAAGANIPAAGTVAQAPATAPAANWQVEGQKVSIDGVGTVELVGVYHTETNPPTWWGPDGKTLEAVPFTDSAISDLDLWQGRMRRRFAVQLSGAAAARMYFWGFDGAQGSRWTGNPPASSFIPRLDIREAEAAFPPEMKTTAIRYGIASPKLITLLEADGRGKPLSENRQVRVTSVRAQGQNTVVFFTVDEPADSEAVVTSFVVNTAGRWVERNDSSRNPHNGQVDYEQHFPLPQSDIQKIVIQCRRYTHWITYANVPLQPGAGSAVVSVQQVAGAK